MESSSFTVKLRPLFGGAYTRVEIVGPVVTAVNRREVLRLAKRLAFWSGAEVRVVLFADAAAGGWYDWWFETTSGLKATVGKVELCPRDDEACHD